MRSSFLDFYTEAKQQYPANIPIKYRMLHPSDEGVICFWQVTFMENFGPQENNIGIYV